MTAEKTFNNIVQHLTANESDVVLGKMMSSPGLKVNNKVFAFYHKEAMGFRLGKEFNAAGFGLKTARWLSPFKTKPPLKAWYIVDFEEACFWRELATMALVFTKQLKK